MVMYDVPLSHMTAALRLVWHRTERYAMPFVVAHTQHTKSKSASTKRKKQIQKKIKGPKSNCNTPTHLHTHFSFLLARGS